MGRAPHVGCGRRRDRVGRVIETRRVGPDDWELFREIRLRALADAPDAFGMTLADAREVTEQGWRERLASTDPLLVVLDEGRPVAMGCGWAPPDREAAFVWGMWTAPEARRRGHAWHLLDELAGWARDLRRELLLHVTQGNEGARRLYERAGFRPTGRTEPLRDGSPLVIEEMRLAVPPAS